jgi:hypothetical protein
MDINGLFIETSEEEAMDVLVEDFKITAFINQSECLGENDEQIENH